MITQRNTSASHPAKASAKAAPAASDGPTSTDASRRAKKRELDRRAQRVARERVKSRIAYLEGVVEEFQKEDGSGQVASLMAQLEKVEKERAQLAKTLSTVADLVRNHGVLGASVLEMAKLTEDKDRKHSIQAETPLANSSFTPVRRNSAPRNVIEESYPKHLQGLLGFRKYSWNSEVSSSTKGHQNSAWNGVATTNEPASQISTFDDMVGVNSWAGCANGPSSEVRNPQVVLHPGVDCECCLVQPEDSNLEAMNLWRYANETLNQRANWEREIMQEDDVINDDIPVRAILEGWDTIEKLGRLTPSWWILRRIDEALFITCGKPERLAILRIMYLLLRFHCDPSPERIATLPVWFLRRPSQTIAHSYATNYLVWPGLRERFVFFQHRYCTNTFWKLFISSVRLQWPFEFRDSYTRHTETGLYKISPLFGDRISDIKTWTMGIDIFRTYPELYSDIPAADGIPASICNLTQHQLMDTMHNNDNNDPDARRLTLDVDKTAAEPAHDISLEQLLASASYPMALNNYSLGQSYHIVGGTNEFIF